MEVQWSKYVPFLNKWLDQCFNQKSPTFKTLISEKSQNHNPCIQMHMESACALLDYVQNSEKYTDFIP
jgi:hypothetical protein